MIQSVNIQSPQSESRTSLCRTEPLKPEVP